jgi:hypothetical protein
MKRPRVAARLIGMVMACIVIQQPGWTQTDDKSHPAQSLAAQSGDPTAPLLQFQLTNFYSPSIYNADGHANAFNFQPIIPVSKSKLIPVPQVLRITVPVITSPEPDQTTGLGDISLVDLFVAKPSSWGIWGLGFTAVAPTAAHDELGQGKWQLGPAATLTYYGIPNWQIGAVVQNPVSIAGDGNRPDVNVFQLQPLVNYLKGDWYFGAGDFNWSYDWKARELTLPLAFQAGRIKTIGRHQYNISLELEWTAVRPEDSVVPKWGVRLGVVLMLPEGNKH